MYVYNLLRNFVVSYLVFIFNNILLYIDKHNKRDGLSYFRDSLYEFLLNDNGLRQ